MRQDPQQLNFIQNRESYTSQTGGPVLPAGATRGFVQKEQIDLSGFVRALQTEGEEFRDMVQEAETKLGRRVAEMQEAGMGTNAIVKQLMGGKSDIRNAKKIAYEIQKRGLEAVDSPWFQLGLTGRKAQYAMRRYFAGVKADETNMATYAGMIANADAGTRGEKMAEVMAEIQKGAVGVMVEFGTIGQSAAEEAMINEMNSFRSELLGRSRKRQTVQHRQLVQESIADIGDNFINDAFDTETKTWNPDPEEVAKFQNALMIENKRVITEGILNPQEIVDGLRGTAAEIANKFGDKAAAEFLSVAAATENPKNGRDLFQGDLASAIQGDISRFEHRAEQDLEKTRELNGRTRSNAKNLIASTPIGQRMLQAKSPEAVREIVNNEIERVVEAQKNGEDPGYPGAFEGNADLQLFYLDALDEYASEKMQSARTTNVVERENVEALVNLAALQGDYNEAYAAIAEGLEGGALAASDANNLMIKIQQNQETQRTSNKDEVWSKVQRPIEQILREHFSPESFEADGRVTPEEQDRINREMRAIEMDILATVSDGQQTEAETLALVNQRIKSTRDSFDSKVVLEGTQVPRQEVRVGDVAFSRKDYDALTREMQAPSEGAAAVFDLKRKALTLGGQPRRIVDDSEGGNYLFPGMDTPIRAMEREIIRFRRKDYEREFKTPGETSRSMFVRSARKFIKTSKLEDAEVRGAILGDGLGKIGLLSSTAYVAIQDGNVDLAKSEYVRTRYGLRGEDVSEDMKSKAAAEAEELFAEDVNLDNISVFALRFNDFVDAEKHVDVDPQTDRVSLSAKADPELVDKARSVLFTAGLNGDSDALVAKFLDVQRIIWSY